MGVVVVLARGRGRRIRGVGAVRGRRRWLSAPPPDGRHAPGKHHGHRRGHRRPLHQVWRRTGMGSSSHSNISIFLRSRLSRRNFVHDLASTGGTGGRGGACTTPSTWTWSTTTRTRPRRTTGWSGVRGKKVSLSEGLRGL